MPTYILLMNCTDQGVKNFKESIGRADAARAALATRAIHLEDGSRRRSSRA